MAYSPVLQKLLKSLRCLPGVGPRTAQRMAFHLLERDRDGARFLSEALAEGLEKIGECEHCRMLAEDSLCWICASADRDPSSICVVESPADVLAIEDAGIFRGRYFVLQGRLSPLDGIGPEELGLDLFERLVAGGKVQEVILATSATVEGEATAGYLAARAQSHNVSATRIAHGVPIGGELEYVDRNTLSRAIAERHTVEPR
ncbi:MAG: recombination mediator RecR [Gammaproteobacteria bacterium]